jgi:hypothetical protein
MEAKRSLLLTRPRDLLFHFRQLNASCELNGRPQSSPNEYGDQIAHVFCSRTTVTPSESAPESCHVRPHRAYRMSRSQAEDRCDRKAWAKRKWKVREKKRNHHQSPSRVRQTSFRLYSHLPASSPKLILICHNGKSSLDSRSA